MGPRISAGRAALLKIRPLSADNGQMTTRRWVAHGGPRLFFIYVIVSLIPIALLGAVLVWRDQQSGTERALAQARAQADVIMQMAISPALDTRPLSDGLTAVELDGLWAATDLAVYSGSLNAIRLRAFDGTVVFADNGASTDPLPADSPEFQQALSGEVPAAIVDAPAGSGERVIRVLQQMVPNVTGQATGVLQIYLPYEPIAAVIRAQQRQTEFYLAGGLAVLYVVLGLVSWTTTRRLRGYAAEQTHHARHDALTGLPNRSWFQHNVTDALQAVGEGSRGAIVLIDLDRFKEVNDTIGHNAGDELLRIVAQRLADRLRPDDVVARLGGDEFGMLLPHVDTEEKAFLVLRHVQARLGEPIHIGDFTLTVEASFGVVFYPRFGTDLTTLLHNADTAMYHGKRGSDRIVMWQPEMATAPSNWHLIRTELERAIAGDELELHYQPKVDLQTGQVREVEALVRWNHPARGMVPPGEFIPVAESSMLIHPLTKWVIRRALADQHEWRARGVDWPVAVNVSAHNMEAHGFAGDVVNLLAAAGASPRDLTLELTETAIAADNELAEDTVARLAEAGVRISLDDFGTGNTGLQQLRHIAVTEVKIDKMFVTNLATNEGDRDLVAAMVDIVHRVGARVVAEGIEDPGCAEWLVTLGCDIGQGFLYHRPVRWIELLRDGILHPVPASHEMVGK
jgi:diguanylate cyclase (GGDEF)-like protein